MGKRCKRTKEDALEITAKGYLSIVKKESEITNNVRGEREAVARDRSAYPPPLWGLVKRASGLRLPQNVLEGAS